MWRRLSSLPCRESSRHLWTRAKSLPWLETPPRMATQQAGQPAPRAAPTRLRRPAKPCEGMRSSMSVEKFKLKSNHSWKSKPGYSICVLDRGVVRFDYPSTWVVEMSDGAVLLHDREPSIESCDLGVSIFRLPAELVAELSMDEMLLNSLGSERNPYQQSEIDRKSV